MQPYVPQALACQRPDPPTGKMTTVRKFSSIDTALQLLELDPLAGVQIFGVGQLAQRHHPPLALNLPGLICGQGNPPASGQVCKILRNGYPKDHPLRWVDTASRTVSCLALAELADSRPLTGDACLFVPALPHSSYADLQEVMAHLRAPDGCPWDREQTIASTRAYLLDETAEALEAMDAADDPHIAEELGDVLGIVAMIAQIATEEGRFQMADAVRLSVEKLIRRHPHVFGEDDVASMGELYRRWDEIKAEERAAQGKPEPGPLEGIPASLPALRKAREMQSKAHKAGLLERAALAKSDPALARLLPAGSDEQALGGLLWRLVALAQSRGLDAEDALRAYITRWGSQRNEK